MVSIEILVLDHGSLRVAGGRNDDSPSEDNSSTATASNNHGGIYNHDGGNNTQESDSNSDDEREHEHLMDALNCIKTIQNQVDKRQVADRKLFRDQPVTNIMVSLVKSRGALDTLSRRWLSQLISNPDSRGCISFDLPESLDGTQCTVTFDVKYKIMPFRADSFAAAGLVADLELLTSSDIELVQLVPISSVDASLVFGVPMAIGPGFQGTVAQYQEMKALVHFLLRFLSSHQTALLLRTRNTGRDLHGRKTSRQQSPGPLYHTNDQTLLLMAEELPGQNLMSSGGEGTDASTASSLPLQTDMSIATGQPVSKDKAVVPVEAMLFRYATAEQILDVGDCQAGSADGDPETLQQLSEYVENSLELLETDFVNPILLGEAKRLDDTFERIARETITSPPNDDIWQETTGVGTGSGTEPEGSPATRGSDIQDHVHDDGGKGEENDHSNRNSSNKDKTTDNSKMPLNDRSRKGDPIENVREQANVGETMDSDDDFMGEWNESTGVGAVDDTAANEAAAAAAAIADSIPTDDAGMDNGKWTNDTSSMPPPSVKRPSTTTQDEPMQERTMLTSSDEDSHSNDSDDKENNQDNDSIMSDPMDTDGFAFHY